MSIEIENESGQPVQLEPLVAVARHTLDQLGVSASAELSMLLVNEERMTELHVQWMDEPGPTDVLSFPMDELDVRAARRAQTELTDQADGLVLGDIVLCPTVADRQAAQAGHSVQDELALLTTHGVLHLVGYDHADPHEHAEMFGLQAELLAQWSDRSA